MKNEQLNMQDIYELCLALMHKGLKLEELPVYLGNDDELNGFHNGWAISLIKRNGGDDTDVYIVNEINITPGVTKLEDKGVVII